MNQKHLNSKKTINLGSYYTPEKYIWKCYDFLKQEVDNIGNYFILDTSCGYGNFLNVPENLPNFCHQKIIGANIDAKAIAVAKETYQEKWL